MGDVNHRNEISNREPCYINEVEHVRTVADARGGGGGGWCWWGGLVRKKHVLSPQEPSAVTAVKNALD